MFHIGSTLYYLTVFMGVLCFIIGLIIVVQFAESRYATNSQGRNAQPFPKNGPNKIISSNLQKFLDNFQDVNQYLSEVQRLKSHNPQTKNEHEPYFYNNNAGNENEMGANNMNNDLIDIDGLPNTRYTLNSRNLEFLNPMYDVTTSSLLDMNVIPELNNFDILAETSTSKNIPNIQSKDMFAHAPLDMKHMPLTINGPKHFSSNNENKLIKNNYPYPVNRGPSHSFDFNSEFEQYVDPQAWLKRMHRVKLQNRLLDDYNTYDEEYDTNQRRHKRSRTNHPAQKHPAIKEHINGMSGIQNIDNGIRGKSDQIYFGDGKDTAQDMAMKRLGSQNYDEKRVAKRDATDIIDNNLKTEATMDPILLNKISESAQRLVKGYIEHLNEAHRNITSVMEPQVTEQSLAANDIKDFLLDRQAQISNLTKFHDTNRVICMNKVTRSATINNSSENEQIHASSSTEKSKTIRADINSSISDAQNEQHINMDAEKYDDNVDNIKSDILLDAPTIQKRTIPISDLMMEKIRIIGSSKMSHRNSQQKRESNNNNSPRAKRIHICLNRKPKYKTTSKPKCGKSKKPKTQAPSQCECMIPATTPAEGSTCVTAHINVCDSVNSADGCYTDELIKKIIEFLRNSLVGNADMNGICTNCRRSEKNIIDHVLTDQQIIDALQDSSAGSGDCDNNHGKCLSDMIKQHLVELLEDGVVSVKDLQNVYFHRPNAISNNDADSQAEKFAVRGNEQLSDMKEPLHDESNQSQFIPDQFYMIVPEQAKVQNNTIIRSNSNLLGTKKTSKAKALKNKYFVTNKKVTNVDNFDKNANNPENNLTSNSLRNQPQVAELLHDEQDIFGPNVPENFRIQCDENERRVSTPKTHRLNNFVTTQGGHAEQYLSNKPVKEYFLKQERKPVPINTTTTNKYHRKLNSKFTNDKYHAKLIPAKYVNESEVLSGDNNINGNDNDDSEIDDNNDPSRNSSKIASVAKLRNRHANESLRVKLKKPQDADDDYDDSGAYQLMDSQPILIGNRQPQARDRTRENYLFQAQQHSNDLVKLHGDDRDSVNDKNGKRVLKSAANGTNQKEVNNILDEVNKEDAKLFPTIHKDDVKTKQKMSRLSDSPARNSGFNDNGKTNPFAETENENENNFQNQAEPKLNGISDNIRFQPMLEETVDNYYYDDEPANIQNMQQNSHLEHPKKYVVFHDNDNLGIDQINEYDFPNIHAQYNMHEAPYDDENSYGNNIVKLRQLLSIDGNNETTEMDNTTQVTITSNLNVTKLSVPSEHSSISPRVKRNFSNFFKLFKDDEHYSDESNYPSQYDDDENNPNFAKGEHNKEIAALKIVKQIGDDDYDQDNKYGDGESDNENLNEIKQNRQHTEKYSSSRERCHQAGLRYDQRLHRCILKPRTSSSSLNHKEDMVAWHDENESEEHQEIVHSDTSNSENVTESIEASVSTSLQKLEGGSEMNTSANGTDQSSVNATTEIETETSTIKNDNDTIKLSGDNEEMNVTDNNSTEVLSSSTSTTNTIKDKKGKNKLEYRAKFFPRKFYHKIKSGKSSIHQTSELPEIVETPGSHPNIHIGKSPLYIIQIRKIYQTENPDQTTESETTVKPKSERTPTKNKKKIPHQERSGRIQFLQNSNDGNYPKPILLQSTTTTNGYIKSPNIFYSQKRNINNPQKFRHSPSIFNRRFVQQLYFPSFHNENSEFARNWGVARQKRSHRYKHSKTKRHPTIASLTTTTVADLENIENENFDENELVLKNILNKNLKVGYGEYFPAKAEESEIERPYHIKRIKAPSPLLAPPPQLLYRPQREMELMNDNPSSPTSQDSQGDKNNENVDSVIEQAAVGDLANKIVMNVFAAVQKCKKLSRSIGLGLYRPRYPNNANISLDTIDNTGISEEMMQGLIAMLNEIICKQIKLRNCPQLPAEWEQFLHWLLAESLKSRESLEDAKPPEVCAARDDVDESQQSTKQQVLFATSEIETETPLPSSTELSSATPAECNPEIKKKINHCLNLYQELSADEQEKVKHLYTYLTDQSRELAESGKCPQKRVAMTTSSTNIIYYNSMNSTLDKEQNSVNFNNLNNDNILNNPAANHLRIFKRKHINLNPSLQDSFNRNHMDYFDSETEFPYIPAYENTIKRHPPVAHPPGQYLKFRRQKRRKV